MTITLSNHSLLSAWEQGQNQLPTQRAMLLLTAAYPEMSKEVLASLSIGQRDTYLLKLRQTLFGSQVISVATCPVCQEKLELNFKVSDILADADEPQHSFQLNLSGYRVEFRLPDSRDFMAVAGSQSLETAWHALFQRCILQVWQGDRISGGGLPPLVIAAILAEMSRHDPQAEIHLDLNCAGCGHSWQAVFDIVTFLWDELNVWAYRLLREVHILASIYGWREADILNLSHTRRQFYLEMVSNERLSH